MKKMLKLLAVAAMIACGLMMTSCTEEDAAVLTGPNNKWCETQIDYDKDGTPDLFVDVIYCTTQVTGNSSTSNQLKNGLEIEPGITVVAYAKVALASTGLSANQYVMKHYSDNDNIEELGSIAGKAKFSAIYWGRADFRKNENQIELVEGTKYYAPTPLTNVVGYSTPSEITFDWKKLLGEYLLR